MNLTAVISKGEDFYIGQIKELPGVVTQGITIEETKDNLLDALALWLKDAHEEANEDVNVVYQKELQIHVG